MKSEAREERDAAFERNMLNALELVNEFNARIYEQRGASSITLDTEFALRCASMLSFCAGYAAGSAPTEALRAFLRRVTP